MADINTARDGGEEVFQLEPLLLSERARARASGRAGLGDLAVELTDLSASLRSQLPDGLRDALASLVRGMNCYYSNLIEGHYTHPVDIERALTSDYVNEPRKRDLQLEARAHIEVQAWFRESYARVT